MEHALFLEKPIRGNPRQEAQQCLSAAGARLPSTPSDTASPPSSQHGHSPPPPATLESDDLLTWPSEQDAGRHMSTISCMIQTPWQSPEMMDILATPSPSDQADPEEQLSTKPTSTSQHARKDSKSGTRKTAKAACSACRKRKSKCDGKRPTCSSCITKNKPCEYLAEEGMSSQAASRRRLEGYATVLRLLQNAHPEDCDRIIRDLRRPKSLAGGVKTVLEKWMPPETMLEI
ncbi:hypothetical protein KCU65_g9704, partial [Aureobasidium melanogenum]